MKELSQTWKRTTCNFRVFTLTVQIVACALINWLFFIIHKITQCAFSHHFNPGINNFVARDFNSHFNIGNVTT